MQIKIVKEKGVLSAVSEIYNDEEVCSYVDCEFFKSIQPISRPTNKYHDYPKYSETIRKYTYEFLYGNKTSNEVLKEIDDITRIYYISIKTDETIFGLIVYIILTIFSIGLVLSFLFLFFEKFNMYFYFLPVRFWFLTLIGYILVALVGYFEIGERTLIKCQLKPLLLSFGFTFIIIPILYKLIVNFPEESKFSKWVKKHKLLFIFVFLFIDIILNLLYLLTPYRIFTMIHENQKNFNICKISNTFGRILICSMLMHKFIIILIIVFLIFIEWNIKDTMYDIRFSVYAIYIDILSIVILIMINFIVINNYIGYFIVRESIIIILLISNYILIFGFRIILAIIHGTKYKSNFIKKIDQNFINNNTVEKSSVFTESNIEDDSNNSYIKENSKTDIRFKVLYYHNKTTSDYSIKNMDQSTFSTNQYSTINN